MAFTIIQRFDPSELVLLFAGKVGLAFWKYLPYNDKKGGGGMKCEYCNSYLAAVPENGVCPNCGGMLPAQPSFQPPFRMLKVPGGCLELGETAVRLRMQFPMPTIRKVDVTMAYDEIYDVSYIPATQWFRGVLCVRSWQQRHIPLPRRFGEHKVGDSFIYFDMKDNSYAGHAYMFLKQWAERNRMQEGKRREM